MVQDTTSKNQSKTILVAPLNWGLGHATRCIPIIRALLARDFKVLLASDGDALELLRKEFPELPSIELPSYQIRYPKKGKHFKWKMMLKIPHIKKTISEEKKAIQTILETTQIDGIISDNRMGVRNNNIPSVFLTHQVNVLSGNTSFFSSKLHQKYISKFDCCWVPDIENPINLSGKLGHPEKSKLKLEYIGLLSRMSYKKTPIKYDKLLLLSGPEPQRSLLEEKLVEVFKDIPERILMVRGVIRGRQEEKTVGNIRMVNFMLTNALEEAINASKLVISRPGYTTIMDLAVLEKKAFFIPTPGQFEQEYLAKQLKAKGIVPSCKQHQFKLEQLKKIPLYSGLKQFRYSQDWDRLFRLFKGE